MHRMVSTEAGIRPSARTNSVISVPFCSNLSRFNSLIMGRSLIPVQKCRRRAERHTPRALADWKSRLVQRLPKRDRTVTHCRFVRGGDAWLASHPARCRATYPVTQDSRRRLITVRLPPWTLYSCAHRELAPYVPDAEARQCSPHHPEGTRREVHHAERDDYTGQTPASLGLILAD